MKKMNKLVRDGIIRMIEMEGRRPVSHIADDKEYYEKLKQKLVEEVGEFLESEKFEELADMLEVMHAICDYKNIDFRQLENERLIKREKRGGFEDRIILEEVE